MQPQPTPRPWRTRVYAGRDRRWSVRGFLSSAPERDPSTFETCVLSLANRQDGLNGVILCHRKHVDTVFTQFLGGTARHGGNPGAAGDEGDRCIVRCFGKIDDHTAI